MKKAHVIGFVVAVATVMAGSVFADGGPIPTQVPDAGSTAVLAAVSAYGLTLCRKLFR